MVLDPIGSEVFIVNTVQTNVCKSSLPQLLLGLEMVDNQGEHELAHLWEVQFMTDLY